MTLQVTEKYVVLRRIKHSNVRFTKMARSSAPLQNKRPNYISNNSKFCLNQLLRFVMVCLLVNESLISFRFPVFAL